MYAKGGRDRPAVTKELMVLAHAGRQRASDGAGDAVAPDSALLVSARASRPAGPLIALEREGGL